MSLFLMVISLNALIEFNHNRTITIIAWFAPEIPARYGPKEFNNLPGLILELYDTHHNFYAESVQFLKNPPKITPFKGDLITEEEYRTRIHSNLDNFKKSIKRD